MTLIFSFVCLVFLPKLEILWRWTLWQFYFVTLVVKFQFIFSFSFLLLIFRCKVHVTWLVSQPDYFYIIITLIFLMYQYDKNHLLMFFRGLSHMPFLSYIIILWVKQGKVSTNRLCVEIYGLWVTYYPLEVSLGIFNWIENIFSQAFRAVHHLIPVWAISLLIWNIYHPAVM